MRSFVKKEEVYDKIAFGNKFRGLIAFAVAIVILIFSMNVVPQVITMYQDFGLPVPAKTLYALYVMLAIMIALAILGIQSIFKTPNKKAIDEKLSKYKSGQLVNLREFNDHKFNLLFFLFVGIFVAYLVISVVVPIYELAESFESHSQGSERKSFNTSNWASQKIGKSDFYIKYPEDALVKEEDDCLKINYGLAYLNILNPGASDGGCLQTGMGAYDQRTAISEKVIIDDTEYNFAGDYVNQTKDPYADGVNYEFYRNEQGVFGNGYKIEYGGYFRLDQLIEYKKDLNVVLDILKSAYRMEKPAK